MHRHLIPPLLLDAKQLIKFGDTIMETARITFAPRRPLFFVPSSVIILINLLLA